MRNLLSLVGFVVVLFGGLGWYLGWYNFSFKPDSEGKVQINGSIDAKKIGADGKKFTQTVTKAIQNFSQPGDEDSKLMGPPLPTDLQQPKTTATSSRPGPAGTNLPSSGR